MIIVDTLIKNIAGKAIMNGLIKAKGYMDGKKTYTGSALGIAAALVGYFTGNLDVKEASATVWLSSMMIFREASAAAKAKKAKKEAEAAIKATEECKPINVTVVNTPGSLPAPDPNLPDPSLPIGA
jgi:hypothetical protein